MNRTHFLVMLLLTHLAIAQIYAEDVEVASIADDVEEVDGWVDESANELDSLDTLVRRKSKRKKCCCSSLRVRCNAAIGGNLAVAKNVAIGGNEAVAGSLAVGEALSVAGRPFLGLVTGTVSATGTAARGTGFTVTPIAAGTFAVVFSQPFSAAPVVVSSPESTTLAFGVSIANVTPQGFTILAPTIGAGDFVDFIAVGL